MLYSTLVKLYTNSKSSLSLRYMVSSALPKGESGLSMLLTMREAILELIDSSPTVSALAENDNEDLNQGLQFSLMEILTVSLSYNHGTNDLNRIIASIKSNRPINLLNNESSSLSEAISLISNIFETHWDDFPIGAKMLILKKLYPLRNRKIIYFKLFLQFILTVLNSKNRAWRQISDYYTYDVIVKRQIDRQVTEELQLLLSNCDKFQRTFQNIFQKDGCLLKRNDNKIHEFVCILKEYKGIADRMIEDQRVIRLTEEDYQVLTENLPIDTFDERLVSDINWYKNLMNKN